MATQRKFKTEENKDSIAFLKAYASYFAAMEGGSLPGSSDLAGIAAGNLLQGSGEELMKLFIVHIQTPN